MSEPEWSVQAAHMVRGIPGVPPAIATAMRSVPRHRFVDATLREQAYRDEPLPLAGDSATISAPHMVALQLEWAELRAGLKVLEVGVGSGYLAALIAELVGASGTVHGVELDPRLAGAARERLTELGYGSRVKVHEGDGRDGWAASAPYERVLVSCAARSILSEWVAQTTDDGTIVAPVGDSYSQTLTRYRRGRGGGIVERGPDCRFVALRSRAPPHI